MTVVKVRRFSVSRWLCVFLLSWQFVGLSEPTPGRAHGRSVVRRAAVSRVAGRLLIKAKPGVADEALQAVLIQNEGVTESTIPQIDVRILKVPEAKLQHALDALSHHTMIEFVEPDYLLPPNATPNDTYYSSQWHLPRIQAPQAWDISTGASSVILAILDTGIDATHPDLEFLR